MTDGRESRDETMARLARGEAHNDFEHMLVGLIEVFGPPDPEIVKGVWDRMDDARAVGGNPLLAAVTAFDQDIDKLVMANEINHAAATDAAADRDVLKEAIRGIQAVNTQIQNYVQANGDKVYPGLRNLLKNLDYECRQWDVGD